MIVQPEGVTLAQRAGFGPVLESRRIAEAASLSKPKRASSLPSEPERITPEVSVVWSALERVSYARFESEKVGTAVYEL